MVLTRTQRRAATAKYGSDQNEDVVPSLDLSPAPEQEAVLRDVETPAKPLMRKSSSLQALNDAARLVRTESWRHIQRQIELAATGDHPLDIQFNIFVAISSFFYLAVTATYASYDNYPLAALFAVISVLSLFADSVAPKNRLVNSLDRIFASLGFILSPMRVMLVPGVASLQVRAMSWALGILSAIVLAWSRASPDMKHYAFRHTVWHAASTAGLVWLAEVEGRGELLEPLTAHVPKFVESLLP